MSKSYRPEVDGLRALAVLAVVIYHFSAKLLPNGFLGVDIFFVISGHVVTLSLVNKEVSSTKVFLLDFYSRRIKRLFPALFFCLLTVSFFSMLFIYPEAKGLSGTAMRTCSSSFIGISNIFLLQKSKDYFSLDTDLNPCTHTWSLGVEEQFYLIFPLLIIFFFMRFAKGVRKKRLLFTLIALSSASFFMYLWLSKYEQTAAFYLMPARLWEFGLGAISYLLLPRMRESLLLKRSTFISGTLVVFLIAVMSLPQVPRPFATLSVAFITSLLLIFLDSESGVKKLFLQSYVVKIGLLSYSIYLWHWPVLALSRWTTGISLSSVLWQLLLIIILSLFSYHFIETRLRKLAWPKTSGKTIIWGLSLALISLYTIRSIHFYLKPNFYLGTTFKHKDENCNGGPSASLAIIGDSHSRAFLPVLNEVSQGRCIAFSGEELLRLSDIGPGTKKLELFSSENLQTKLKSNKELKAIIIVYYWQGYFSPQSYSYKNSDWLIKKYSVANNDYSFDEAFSKMIHTIEVLAKSREGKDKKIIIILPAPDFNWVNNGGPPNGLCRKEWFRPNPQQLEPCLEFSKPDVKDRAVVEKRREHLIEGFHNLASSNKNIVLFDPMPSLCFGNVCSTHEPSGNAIFRDDDHINQDGAKLLVKPFAELLNSHALLSTETTNP